MWDTKRQIQFKGIKHSTINVKNTKFDVNISERSNPVDFLWQISTLEQKQSPFVTLENV